MRERQARNTSLTTSSGSTDRVGRFKAKEQRRNQGHFDSLKEDRQSDDIDDDFLSTGMSRLRILNIATREPMQRKNKAIRSEVQEGRTLPDQTSSSSFKVVPGNGTHKSIPNDEILEKIKAAARSKRKQKSSRRLPGATDEKDKPTAPQTTSNPNLDPPASSSRSTAATKNKTKKSREQKANGEKMKTSQLKPKKSRSSLSIKIKPATSSEDLYTSNLQELQKAAAKYNNTWYTFGLPPPQAQATAEARDARHERSKKHYEKTPRESSVQATEEAKKSPIRHTHDDEDSIDKEEQYATFVDRLRRVSKNYRDSLHQKYTRSNQVVDNAEVLTRQAPKSDGHHPEKSHAPSKPRGRNHARANYPISDSATKSHMENYSNMEDDDSIPSQYSNDDSFQGGEEGDEAAAFSSFSRGSLDDQSVSATSEESIEDGWLSWFDKW